MFFKSLVFDFTVLNVKVRGSSDLQTLRFAGVTFSSALPVLVTIQLGSKVTVNSEKMVINSMLMKTVMKAVTT